MKSGSVMSAGMSPRWCGCITPQPAISSTASFVNTRDMRISWGLNLIYEQERMIMESIQAVGKELLKEN